jgi:hypothetical protein
VDAAEVTEGEGLGEDVEGERRVVQLLAEARAGVFGDDAVIEGKWGKRGGGMPGGGAYTPPGARCGRLAREKGVVRNGDRAPARIATWIAEGVQLLEESAPHTGAVGQDARGGGFERLVSIDDAAREGPRAGKGLGGALDEQQLERPVAQGEAGDVDGERNTLDVRGHAPPGSPRG